MRPDMAIAEGLGCVAAPATVWSRRPMTCPVDQLLPLRQALDPMFSLGCALSSCPFHSDND